MTRLVLTLLYLISLVLADTFTATELPDTSVDRFPFYHILTPLNDTENGFEFYWNLENPSQPNESLHFVMMLAGFPESPSSTALNRAWMAIGFGANMRNADFIRIGQVEVHQHISTPRYEPPARGATSNLPFQVVSAGYVQGVLFAEIRKSTRGANGLRPLVTLGGSQQMIWAFNPQSKQLPDGQWFTYHGPNGPADQPFSQTHGAISVNYRSGIVSSRPLISYKNLQIHGLGMSLMFLVLMPMGIFISRYLKSTPRWVHFHAGVQSAAALGVGVFFGLVLATYQQYTQPHPRLGLVIVCLVILQVMFGGATRLGMIRGDIQGFVWLRFLHRCTGTLIVVLAVAQVGLGLNILYPAAFSRGREYWYIYGAVVAIWSLVFISAEVYYYRVSRRRVHVSDEKAMLMDPTKSDASRIPQEKLATLMHFHQSHDSTTLLKYTWKSLDQEIRNSGKILVVANGKYVYDASKWIHSHPGGKVILYSVAGTDITMDFFREAGYDAAQFVPKPTAPQRPTHHRAPPSLYSDASSSSRDTPTIMTQDMAANLQNASWITEENWDFVEKARRTHVHTRQALERLSKIFVGELVHNEKRWGSEVTLNTSHDRLPFDPYEYRRYTMTEKVLLTDDGNAATRCYKLKFTSLYPYDVRDNQPSTFLFGSCVEIMMRLPDGRMISRYYTPIQGNLTCFEVIVKITGGLMTSLMDKYRCGDRQFKIRGPFGQSCLQPPPEYEMNHPVPPNIVFITAGSGITPFLQFLTTAMLPVNEALVVSGDYQPQASDEMAIKTGDYVATLSHYYDGWAFGTNLSTGAQGSFPLSLVLPAAGRGYKVTLIHCSETTSDIVGREWMDAAMSAYPQQLDIHHIVNDMSLGVRDGVTGFIRQGRLDDRTLKELVCQIQSNGFEYGRRAVICGPNMFNSYCVDVLMESLGWSQHEIHILSESNY